MSETGTKPEKTRASNEREKPCSDASSDWMKLTHPKRYHLKVCGRREQGELYVQVEVNGCVQLFHGPDLGNLVCSFCGEPASIKNYNLKVDPKARPIARADRFFPPYCKHAQGGNP